MPKKNNAAQAAEQEIDAIMEQAQVFASAWAFLGGPFDNGSGLEQAEREKANLRALLSKLRAPVADERECGNADCGWRGTTERMCGSVGPLCPDCGETTEVSAPVAGEAPDTYRNMLLEAVHRYGNARAMAEHDIKQRGQISTTVAAILDLLDAAPQASTEDVRNTALVALEAAQQFIRNGIELGYIRMPDADTPDPAHRTPGLIDIAIHALKHSGGEMDDREAWAADMLAAGAKHLGGDCWEWDVDDFEFRLWQVATRRTHRTAHAASAKAAPKDLP